MSTYLVLLLITISVPLILSFDKKVHFYTQWGYLFPALLLSAAFFIVWDIFFTLFGVWQFNDLHLTGITLLYLPLEEWLFFLFIPYASVFIYEVIRSYLPHNHFGKLAISLSHALIALFLITALLNLSRIYTSITFILTALYLAALVFVARVRYLGWFYLTFAIVLLPFLLINGVLTGSGLEQPVVFYNNDLNLGIRLLTIPIEDLVYGFLLILMNISLLEKFREPTSHPG